MSTWQTLYVFTDRMTHFSLKMVTSVGDATPVSEAMNTSSGQPNSALHWAYESPPVTVRLALTSTSSTTVREQTEHIDACETFSVVEEKHVLNAGCTQH
jgi:hypothetical protein